MNDIQGVTPDGLWVFCLVGVGLMCIFNIAMSVRKNWREYQKEQHTPAQTVEQQMKDHDKMLANDKRRIDALEERAENNEKALRLLLKGQLAMLSHEINGNSIEKLKKSLTDTQDFLVDER